MGQTKAEGQISYDREVREGPGKVETAPIDDRKEKGEKATKKVKKMRPIELASGEQNIDGIIDKTKNKHEKETTKEKDNYKDESRPKSVKKSTRKHHSPKDEPKTPKDKESASKGDKPKESSKKERAHTVKGEPPEELKLKTKSKERADKKKEMGTDKRDKLHDDIVEGSVGPNKKPKENKDKIIKEKNKKDKAERPKEKKEKSKDDKTLDHSEVYEGSNNKNQEKEKKKVKTEKRTRDHSEKVQEHQIYDESNLIINGKTKEKNKKEEPTVVSSGKTGEEVIAKIVKEKKTKKKEVSTALPEEITKDKHASKENNEKSSKKHSKGSKDKKYKDDSKEKTDIKPENEYHLKKTLEKLKQNKSNEMNGASTMQEGGINNEIKNQMSVNANIVKNTDDMKIKEIYMMDNLTEYEQERLKKRLKKEKKDLNEEVSEIFTDNSSKDVSFKKIPSIKDIYKLPNMTDYEMQYKALRDKRKKSKNDEDESNMDVNNNMNKLLIKRKKLTKFYLQTRSNSSVKISNEAKQNLEEKSSKWLLDQVKERINKLKKKEDAESIAAGEQIIQYNDNSLEDNRIDQIKHYESGDADNDDITKNNPIISAITKKSKLVIPDGQYSENGSSYEVNKKYSKLFEGNSKAIINIRESKIKHFQQRDNSVQSIKKKPKLDDACTTLPSCSSKSKLVDSTLKNFTFDYVLLKKSKKSHEEDETSLEGNKITKTHSEKEDSPNSQDEEGGLELQTNSTTNGFNGRRKSNLKNYMFKKNRLRKYKNEITSDNPGKSDSPSIISAPSKKENNNCNKANLNLNSLETFGEPNPDENQPMKETQNWSFKAKGYLSDPSTLQDDPEKEINAMVTNVNLEDHDKVRNRFSDKAKNENRVMSYVSHKNYNYKSSCSNSEKDENETKKTNALPSVDRQTLIHKVETSGIANVDTYKEENKYQIMNPYLKNYDAPDTNLDCVKMNENMTRNEMNCKTSDNSPSIESPVKVLYNFSKESHNIMNTKVIIKDPAKSNNVLEIEFSGKLNININNEEIKLGEASLNSLEESRNKLSINYCDSDKTLKEINYHTIRAGTSIEEKEKVTENSSPNEINSINKHGFTPHDDDKMGITLRKVNGNGTNCMNNIEVMQMIRKEVNNEISQISYQIPSDNIYSSKPGGKLSNVENNIYGSLGGQSSLVHEGNLTENSNNESSPLRMNEIDGQKFSVAGLNNKMYLEKDEQNCSYGQNKESDLNYIEGRNQQINLIESPSRMLAENDKNDRDKLYEAYLVKLISGVINEANSKGEAHTNIPFEGEGSSYYPSDHREVMLSEMRRPQWHSSRNKSASNTKRMFSIIKKKLKNYRSNKSLDKSWQDESSISSHNHGALRSGSKLRRFFTSEKKQKTKSQCPCPTHLNDNTEQQVLTILKSLRNPHSIACFANNFITTEQNSIIQFDRQLQSHSMKSTVEESCPNKMSMQTGQTRESLPLIQRAQHIRNDPTDPERLMESPYPSIHNFPNDSPSLPAFPIRSQYFNNDLLETNPSPAETCQKNSSFFAAGKKKHSNKIKFRRTSKVMKSLFRRDKHRNVYEDDTLHFMKLPSEEVVNKRTPDPLTQKAIKKWIKSVSQTKTSSFQNIQDKLIRKLNNVMSSEVTMTLSEVFEIIKKPQDNDHQLNSQEKNFEFIDSTCYLSNYDHYIIISEQLNVREFLVSIGFKDNAAWEASENPELTSRLLYAINEARCWANKILVNQGLLIYILAVIIPKEISNYYLQIVEAIVNRRITKVGQLLSVIMVLKKFEEGELETKPIINQEQKKEFLPTQVLQAEKIQTDTHPLCSHLYNNGKLTTAGTIGETRKNDVAGLLARLAMNNTASLKPYINLLAYYIAQNVITNQEQLSVAVSYLQNLCVNNFDQNQFEQVCGLCQNRVRLKDEFKKEEVTMNQERWVSNTNKQMKEVKYVPENIAPTTEHESKHSILERKASTIDLLKCQHLSNKKNYHRPRKALINYKKHS